MSATGPLQLHAGAGGLPTATLVAPDGARVELALHGGHVLSWCPAPDGRERLFLSARSAYRRDAAIRGGVPIIFPQFSDRGPLPRHGFARTQAWELGGPAVVVADGRARATVRLADSPMTRAIWPHAFVAELTIAVGGPQLELTLAIENSGDAPFDFTAALHSYLRVDAIADTTLHGLRGIRYVDSTDGSERTEDASSLAVDGEVDRIYLDAPATLELRERDVPRLDIRTSGGFSDTVVWNPGPERAAALSDLEPGGFARFLCVESAVIGVPPTVAPGARWQGTQTLLAR